MKKPIYFLSQKPETYKHTKNLLAKGVPYAAFNDYYQEKKI